MQASVKRIHIDENKRIIAVSDIHGDLDGLKQLLSKINFTTKDVLFLVGDMVEKGNQSLDTLHYIMNLCRTHTVHSICGNCDAIAKAVFNNKENKELLSYLIWRKNSLLYEMCESISIHLTEETDMSQVKEILKTQFKEELDWIKTLPDIIETENFIFVHAGLTSNNLDEQKESQISRLEGFMNQGLSMDKYCVVGHWPVILYCKSIPCSNPIIDKDLKIISIDGGNVLKRDGQLNALIIPNINSEEFSFVSQDNLDRGVALDYQVESEKSIIIPWIDNRIKILKKEDEFSYCEQISTKFRMWILNKYIFEDKDEFFCEDSTDYQLFVKEGDILQLIEITKKGYLVKKNGVIGWYYGRLKLEG